LPTNVKLFLEWTVPAAPPGGGVTRVRHDQVALSLGKGNRGPASEFIADIGGNRIRRIDAGTWIY